MSDLFNWIFTCCTRNQPIEEKMQIKANSFHYDPEELTSQPKLVQNIAKNCQKRLQKSGIKNNSSIQGPGIETLSPQRFYADSHSYINSKSNFSMDYKPGVIKRIKYKKRSSYNIQSSNKIQQTFFQMSEILDQELELLRSMYMDELEETENSVSLKIIPATFEDIAQFVTATLTIFFSNLQVKISNREGFDDVEELKIAKKVQKFIDRGKQRFEDSLIFQTIEFSRELLTHLNDNITGSCIICLESFSGDLNLLCRIPKCFHRFHKECLDAWWFKHDNLLTCPICRQEISIEEAKSIIG